MKLPPTEDIIGREVEYTGNRYPGGKPEFGVITSFNDKLVFVRYDGKRTSEATHPDDLEFCNAPR